MAAIMSTATAGRVKYVGEHRAVELASGEGQVWWQYTLSGVAAQRYNYADDSKELLEEIECDGSLADRKAIRAMIQGFVVSYAEAN